MFSKRKSAIMSLVLAFTLMLMSGMTVFAGSLEDDLGGGGTGTSQVSDPGFLNGEGETRDLSGLWSDVGGVSGEQVSVASKMLAPLTNMIGYIVGGILVIVFSGIFLITAIDLLYLAIPPLRNVLYKGEGGGGGAVGGGIMPGGFGGFGRRGGYGSYNQGMAAEARPIRFISDEAVQCAAMLQNGGAQPQIAGGVVGGAQMQGGQNMSMKSVMLMYFKKRAFFLVVLVICAVVLTSSVLLGTGMNLANWITKIINSLNNNIPK